MQSPEEIIDALAARGATIAVAESLTGGLLTARLIGPAGASRVVLGGIVAYNSELKVSLLGVDASLLSEHGAVHPDVARAMASGVRDRLGAGLRPATIGVATTGVAGPDPQDGQQPGVVYLGLSLDGESRARRLNLSGSRDQIRARAATCAIAWIAETLERGLAFRRE